MRMQAPSLQQDGGDFWSEAVWTVAGNAQLLPEPRETFLPAPSPPLVTRCKTDTAAAAQLGHGPEPGTAEKINMPLIVCVADQEVYSNPAFQGKIAKQAPFGEVRHYPGEHFDFCHGMFEQVIADEIDFLQRHLLATSP
jgi:hypothetical protein